MGKKMESDNSKGGQVHRERFRGAFKLLLLSQEDMDKAKDHKRNRTGLQGGEAKDQAHELL